MPDVWVELAMVVAMGMFAVASVVIGTFDIVVMAGMVIVAMGMIVVIAVAVVAMGMIVMAGMVIGIGVVIVAMGMIFVIAVVMSMFAVAVVALGRFAVAVVALGRFDVIGVFTYLVTMVVFVAGRFLFVIGCSGFDRSCSHDPLCGRATGVEEVVQPALETQAVLEDKLRVVQGDTVLWSGLVAVGIAIRTDQRSQVDVIAPHLMHQVP